MRALNVAFKLSVVVFAALAMFFLGSDFLAWYNSPTEVPTKITTTLGANPSTKPGGTVRYKGHWWKVVRKSENWDWNTQYTYELELDDAPPSAAVSVGKECKCGIP